MGRSVSVPCEAVAVGYQDVTYMNDVDDPYMWTDYTSNIIDITAEQWPSLYPCDKWIGREDLVLLENEFAYIGVSEYCGLTSVWLVCKADYEDIEREGIARAWCRNISGKFLELFSEYEKLGTMSNGESVYTKTA